MEFVMPPQTPSRIEILETPESEDTGPERRKGKLSALLRGLLVVIPIYLAVLLMLKAMNSLLNIVKPVTKLIPVPDWLPTGQILSVLLILLFCFVVGLLVGTRMGKSTKEKLEKRVLCKIPGYTTVRNLTNRMLGESRDKTWKPALAEIEEALVPAFIIEELDDGRFTVFVPSIPTPLAGAVYILGPDRVHPVNVPFTQAIRVVSQWGAGAKALVAAMEPATRIEPKRQPYAAELPLELSAQ
jgi:uncharacterized membrane protein